MSFEDAWYGATYNVFWYVKFLIPVIAAILAMILRLRWMMVLLLLVAIPMTYAVSVGAITRKWDLRFQAAKTDNEKSSVAASDGANLVFGAMFIGPFEALVYNAITFGIAAAVVAARKVKKNDNEPENQTGANSLELSMDEIGRNSYSPPQNGD
jgi:hypothetical protein